MSILDAFCERYIGGALRSVEKTESQVWESVVAAQSFEALMIASLAVDCSLGNSEELKEISSQFWGFLLQAKRVDTEETANRYVHHTVLSRDIAMRFGSLQKVIEKAIRGEDFWKASRAPFKADSDDLRQCAMRIILLYGKFADNSSSLSLPYCLRACKEAEWRQIENSTVSFTRDEVIGHGLLPTLIDGMLRLAAYVSLLEELLQSTFSQEPDPRLATIMKNRLHDIHDWRLIHSSAKESQRFEKLKSLSIKNLRSDKSMADISQLKTEEEFESIWQAWSADIYAQN